jgi:ABC-2 type transport system permease protein
MKTGALVKKEARDILQNRIYILVVVVQVFIILGAFGLAFISSMATDSSLIDEFGIASSFKVGLNQDLKDSSLARNLEDQNLSLNYYSSTEEALPYLGKNLMVIISVSNSGEVTVKADNSNVFYPVLSAKITKAINQYKIQQNLENKGLSQDKISAIKNPVIYREIPLKENEKSPLALDSPYFVQIMYGFIVPFVLLLPFFLASNIITDSVVGEKERKTFEVLLMVPLSSYMVIIAKIIPILLFSLGQSMAWIILLHLLNVPIYNPFLLILVLFFVGLGFIGMGVLISMLVDSTKEANSAITIVLIFATFILFVPLFIKSSWFTGLLNYIPTVIMIKMASSPQINFGILINLLPTILLSLIIFLGTVRLFRHERTLRL